jgi:phosphopentomutase
VVLVIDSLGCGALPDADDYGDAGSATLQHLAIAAGGVRLPNLGALGLGNIVPVVGTPPATRPAGAFGRMAEVSPGKDSTTGHWEMMGLLLDKPFPTYPDGFPGDLLRAFEARIGARTLGNVAASGTAIIQQLGDEHVRTGFPIVYTSADSVFQIAAHEDVIPIERQYEICRIARALLVGPHAVSRVIARPFVGASGAYVRTERRKDFSVAPTGPTVMAALRAAGVEVWGVGKIEDLFAGQGLSRSLHTTDDAAGMAQTAAALDELTAGLLFTNLVDSDMKYGHRNDAAGYARNLERVDGLLPRIRDRLRAGDVLVVTGDHGNDPTTPSTDHAREYVPLLVSGPGVRAGVDLGTRATFADVGATAAETLGVAWPGPGRSFLAEVAG